MTRSVATSRAKQQGLERQLDEAQQTIKALVAGQVDAVLDADASSIILLQQAQDAIRRLAAIVESSQDAIISMTIDGRVMTWNAAAERLFGYSAKEAADQPLEALLPVHAAGDTRTILSLASATATATGGDGQMDSVRATKGGAPVAVSMSVSAVTNLAGTSTSISVIARDITARMVEDEQRQKRRKLESIGRLAAGVAHEINTPIQFIGDNLHFLKDGFASIASMVTSAANDRASTAAPHVPAEGSTNDVAYLLTEIPIAIRDALDGVQRVAAIIRGLKEFSHPGSSAPMPFDLNAAVESTITISRNEHRHVAEIETHLAEDLPAIVGKVHDIQQVILILIVNAAQSIAGGGRPGKGTITITTVRRQERIELRVSDTGPGVPEGVRAHLFEPFFTTKPVGAGTGQGLYIAHDIVVNRHHGSIAYEPGAGATFVVEIPIQPTVILDLLRS